MGGNQEWTVGGKLGCSYSNLGMRRHQLNWEGNRKKWMGPKHILAVKSIERGTVKHNFYVSCLRNPMNVGVIF